MYAQCTQVGMPSSRDDRLHLRIHGQLKEELKIAAELEGLKPSQLIHSLVVKFVAVKKAENPAAFAKREAAPEVNASGKRATKVDTPTPGRTARKSGTDG